MAAYNTEASALALAGQEISSELLELGQSVVHGYTKYRWASTSKVDIFSGRGEGTSLWLSFPIISVTSFTIDFGSGTASTQTEETDFYVRKPIGELFSYHGLPTGFDNLVVTYKHGWQSSDLFYQETISRVRMAEAMIALHLKKNPLLMAQLGIPGAQLSFSKSDKVNVFWEYLSLVPQPQSFGSLGRL